MKCLIFNCTLKPSPETSNTQALCEKVSDEFGRLGCETETIRVVDYNIKPGTSSNEGPDDEWPQLFERIKDCHIFILATPIWVGHIGSVAQRVIERLDSLFHEKGLHDPERGQYSVYNKVGGAIVTGNEDGAHQVVARIFQAFNDFGFTIPPNSNTYWVGPAGAGPSYISAEGDKSLFVNKTVLYAVHNLHYMAKLLQDHPIPVNLRELTERAEEISKQ